MGTGRKLNKKPMTRPIKGASERQRRNRTQQKRLVALGMDEAVVSKMTSAKVRELLQRPAKVTAAAAR